MHSSRIRTARSSSRRGGLDLIPLNFPLGCWPGPDPPEFPPWVWAWTWSPPQFPPGCGPGGGLHQAPPSLCYGLSCGGLLVWWPPPPPPPRRPYQKAAFNQKATKPEGHNRRPQQKAITEGHPPRGDTPPPGRRPPGDTPLLQGMLGYHLQWMLG